jgi:hypothetical protein
VAPFLQRDIISPSSTLANSGDTRISMEIQEGLNI